MSRLVRRGLVALAVAVVLTGCGSASPPSPPSGVDGLEIPTPSPDPDDFVGEIDNPWFPVLPGATWTYAAESGDPADPTIVTSSAGPSIAGVDTTALTTLTAGSGATGLETTDWYAQDRSGNVWWFGREGEWQAGVDGAEAGLMMPARPRFGDGFQSALTGGVDDVRAEVVAIDGAATVQAGEYDDLVVIDSTTAPDGVVVRRSYARGTGLVEQATPGGDPGVALGLVSYVG